jgi:heme/copper-type cytochrome/quinol oxidase subunit 3
MTAVAETTLARPRSASNGWWAMVLLIATEATLFAVLIASYFYLRFQTPGSWPPGGTTDPKLPRAAVMTAVLVASTLLVHAGEAGIRRGSRRALGTGLAFGFLLGLAFLGLQIWETDVVARELSPRTDAYGSLFFTITGAHSAHLAAGLLLVAWVQVRAWAGSYSPRRHLGVQVAALYWHFVVVTQLAIFATLYLSPRL